MWCAWVATPSTGVADASSSTCGHRGHKGDPLYAARRTLHTGAGLLTDKQKDRLERLFADDAHVEVEATWGVYQPMITASETPTGAKEGR